MKASALLDAVQAQLAAALPSWTVVNGVAHAPRGSQVDLRLTGSVVGGYVFGQDEVNETLTIRAVVTTSGGTTAAQRTLLDARDTISQTVLSDAFATALTNEVKTFDDGSKPTWDEPSLYSDGRQTEAFFITELSIPLKRRLG